MEKEITQLILEKIASMSKEMTEGFSQIRNDIAELKNDIEIIRMDLKAHSHK
jgi:hypothetical protein